MKGGGNMEQVHVCLLGEWVNLYDDPNSKIGPNLAHPSIWWEENAELWSPITKEESHTMYQQDYVYVNYKGRDYRIHPMFIQIVTS